jgi:hypothetical protein
MKKNFIIVTSAAALFLLCCGRNTSVKTNHTQVDASKVTFKTKTELLAISNNQEHFQVNAAKGEQITTANGARILIAPRTFVTSAGAPVEGNVEVSYKAINTFEEIVASGIPMQANNNGEIGQFISDGMFEINASANGEKVQVAEGKNIQVFTKSRDKDSEFKYWFFNKTKGIWEETGTRTELADDKQISSNVKAMGINPNTGLTAGNMRWRNNEGAVRYAFVENGSDQELVPNKMIPGKYDPKKLTLDINFNAGAYPELAAYSSLMWQFAGTNPNMDPARNNWIFQNSWTDVSLEPIADKPGFFDLQLSSGGQRFKTVVRPVVNGKDLDKAQEVYAQELAKIKEMQKQQMEAGASEQQISSNMYNAFNVAQMGVYNCDRFYSDKAAEEYTASFEMEGETLDPNRMVYIIMDGRKNVIQYTASSYKMRLNPEKVDAIFTVAATGAIAAVNNSSLAAMKKKRGGNVHLAFEKVQVKINSLGSLKEAIESI